MRGGTVDAGEDQIVSRFDFHLIVCVCGQQRDDVVDDKDDNKSAVRSTKRTGILCVSRLSPSAVSSPLQMLFIRDDGLLPISYDAASRRGNYRISFAPDFLFTHGMPPLSRHMKAAPPLSLG